MRGLPIVQLRRQLRLIPSTPSPDIIDRPDPGSRKGRHWDILAILPPSTSCYQIRSVLKGETMHFGYQQTIQLP